MKRIGILCLILGIAKTATAQTPATNAAAPAENVVQTVENRVEAARSGTEAWVPAAVGRVLRVKDQLRTGFKSRATVQLSNRSVIRMNQLSTIEIQPATTDEKRSLIDLKKGAAYFYNRETPVETEFRTPLASGAIRGTEFNLSVDDDGRTVIALIDGQVNLSNELGATNLVSGEMGIVEKGQPPRKTALINAINIIQWSLYYPGVVDVTELELTAAEMQALNESITAYRAGDLLRAAAAYPTNRPAGSAAEQLYRAAVTLAVGQVEETETILNGLPPGGGTNSRPALVAGALRQLIAAVKNQPWVRSSAATLATEWLAESYYQQSQSKLEAALQAARKATELSPAFGYAWVRVAELEFSFGRTKAALAALDKGLEISPRNAQGIALKGFLLAAQNKFDQAIVRFNEAIAVDGALGNAWLGRGLCRIRQALNFFSFDLTARSAREGRQDLQTAAALEPNRAVLRSYLAKAYLNEWDLKRASKEVDLAKKLDLNDPSSWLYSSLIDAPLNRVNDAVKELEKSKELNDNRSVFRSRMLLDQDRAVRGANLARMYRDAGMLDLSVREASYAVNSDYANYSAHLFLANSYDALRDPRSINLRYETPWLSEWLLANLLAPVGGGTLSQNISSQEYSPLLERNRVGMSSLSEYYSYGEWFERASQFANLGSSSYAIDTFYHSSNGRRPNNDAQDFNSTVTFKQQLTAQDTLFVEGVYSDASFGDRSQVFNNQNAASYSLTQRSKERQEPLVFLGYHREWGPGMHTLIMAGRLNDTSLLSDPAGRLAFFSRTPGGPSGYNYFGYHLRNELDAYSSEIQQIWQQNRNTAIAGAKYQTAASDTSADVVSITGLPSFANYGTPVAQQYNTTLQRVSVYAYDQWRIVDPLQLIAGVSYDRLDYPKNIDFPVISADKLSKDQVSPKVGFILTPFKNTHLRGAYTHSLGGVFFDQSVRLEPTQVGGFTQAYRSMIPETISGLVGGSRFKTADLALDHEWPTHTYVSVQGEILNSQAEQYQGMLDVTTFLTAVPTSTPDRLDYEEKSLTLTVNQLLWNEWSLGASYRLTHSDLQQQFTSLPAGGAAFFDQRNRATIHQFTPYVIFNHRCGFFSEFMANYNRQSNRGYAIDEPGDNFWQFHFFGGYRFLQRRAEVRLGVLNLTDRDYRLNPLTLYAELPRVRTFTASLRFSF